VSESSRLASPAVNGNAYIHDVADVAEEVVEVLVRHFKRHIADEKGLGRRVLYIAALVRTAGLGVLLRAVELHNEVPALEDLHVKVLDGSLGVIGILKLDVTEAEGKLACALVIQMRFLPSAQTPVIVDDLDFINLAEAGEDTLELVCRDLVVQVADVERRVRLRRVGVHPPLWPTTRTLCLLGHRCQTLLPDGSRCISGLSLCSFLGRRKVFFDGRLRCCLRKAL
jgi:hypothetical protein